MCLGRISHRMNNCPIQKARPRIAQNMDNKPDKFLIMFCKTNQPDTTTGPYLLWYKKCGQRHYGPPWLGAVWWKVEPGDGLSLYHMLDLRGTIAPVVQNHHDFHHAFNRPINVGQETKETISLSGSLFWRKLISLYLCSIQPHAVA